MKVERQSGFWGLNGFVDKAVGITFGEEGNKGKKGRFTEGDGHGLVEEKQGECLDRGRNG